MPQITQNRIVWSGQDLYGGFAPNTLASSPTADIRKIGAGYSFGKNYDPFRIPGMAYPGQTPTALTGVSASAPNALQIAGVTGGGLINAYTVGGAELNRTTTLFGVPGLGSAAPFPFTIVGAGVHSGHTVFTAANGDIKIYKVGTVTKVFFSYTDTTDWDVGIVTPGSPDVVDVDFMSDVPATPLGTVAADLTNGTGKNHPLFVSQDGFMYIGSGRHVHRFDGQTGANGTFISQFGTLPEGYNVKGFAEDGFFLFVFADRDAGAGVRSTASVFLWGADRGVNFDKLIPLNEDVVAAPFPYKGTVGCFTDNRQGTKVLRLFNGETFDLTAEFPGALPSIGGVEIQDDLIKWNSDGKIWGYGSYLGQFPVGLHQLASVGSSSGGFLKAFFGALLFSGGAVGANTGMVTFSDYADDAQYAGLAAFPKFPAGQQGRIKQVDVAFARTATGGRAIAFQLFLNDTQVTLADSIEEVTVGDRLRSYRYDSNDAKFPHFTSIAPFFSWSLGSGATDAPGVESVVAHYEPVRNKTSY